MNKIEVFSSGEVRFQEKTYKAALGSGGVTDQKREGDGATPLGCFPIREVYFRKDRIESIDTALPIKVLQEDDIWVDDVDDASYNKFAKAPYAGSHEKLWREDHLYDIIVVLGYNDSPPVPGKGSAIFMHIAREEYTPTAGCVALGQEDLLEILAKLDLDTQVCVRE